MPTTSAEPSKDTTLVPSWRIPEIDGLRALAILMVFVCHAWLFANQPVVPINILGHSVNFMTLFSNGSTGVDLFMVLSGFCLFFPLCKSPEALQLWSPANFYKKRIRRIVPPYYMAIVYSALLPVVLVALFRLMHWPANWQSFESPFVYVAHLLFLQTLIPQVFGKINAAFWSMGLEVQFYLVFPLVVALYRQFQLWTIVGMIVVSIGYRIIVQQYLPGMEPDVARLLPIFFIGRWMQFAMGMGAAWIVAHQRRAGHWRSALQGNALLLVGVLLYCVSLFDIVEWVENVVLGVAFSLFMVGLCVTQTPLRALFDNRLMRWIGYISYSIFLTHWPTLYYVAQLVEKKTPFRGLPQFVVLCLVGLPIVVGCSYLFFLLFEKPFLNKPTSARRKAPASI